ncbi:MAG: AbrB/MazE/SpoVT family DNA-binding domain-containing protein [Methanophagales archaeon]|nr:AbrB/MazE/SpoVT family DNA-binding domain-containing protein [Methanophagales archaeon]
MFRGNMEARIDAKGRIVIPKSVREKLQIREGMLILIEEKKDKILLSPKREKKRNVEDFFGLKVKRTGRPEWATPKEIKSIWE